MSADKYRELALNYGVLANNNSEINSMNKDIVNTVEEAGEILQLSPFLIQAVAEKESNNRSDTGLFERHVFQRNLPDDFNMHDWLKDHPEDWDILKPTPFKARAKGLNAEDIYGSFDQQFERLDRAKRINKEAAYKAFSSSKYQILGENHDSLGYDTAEALFNDLSDPDNQLSVFVKYMQANPEALKALRNTDFDKFSKLYNGKNSLPSYVAELTQHYNRLVARANPKKGTSKSRTVTRTVAKTGGTVLVGGGVANEVSNLIEVSNNAIKAMQEKVKGLEELKNSSSTLKKQVENIIGEITIQSNTVAELSTRADWLLYGLLGAGVVIVILTYYVIKPYKQDHGYID